MSDPLAEIIDAAAAAGRVLEGHQRRRSLGRALFAVRSPQLLCRARRQVSAGSRWRASGHAAGRRFRAPAVDAQLHDVGVRAGDPVAARSEGHRGADGDVRHGRRGGPPDVRLLGGYFLFDSPDAPLLVSLLPAILHIRGVERLTALVGLVSEESRERMSGRDLVLARLIEVLLIEALRARNLTRTHRPVCCAAWPMRGSRQRSATSTAIRALVDRGRSSPRRSRCRARPSSTDSREPWGCRRWNICSRGAWLSRRTCYVARTLGSQPLPSESATARRVPSVPRSAGTLVSRRAATRANAISPSAERGIIIPAQCFAASSYRCWQ